MEALQNGQTTVEGSIEGQSAGAASHAMIEKILSEEPRWQGIGSLRWRLHSPLHSYPMTWFETTTSVRRNLAFHPIWKLLSIYVYKCLSDCISVHCVHALWMVVTRLTERNPVLQEQQVLSSPRPFIPC